MKIELSTAYTGPNKKRNGVKSDFPRTSKGKVFCQCHMHTIQRRVLLLRTSTVLLRYSLLISGANLDTWRDAKPSKYMISGLAPLLHTPNFYCPNTMTLNPFIFFFQPFYLLLVTSVYLNSLLIWLYFFFSVRYSPLTSYYRKWGFSSSFNHILQTSSPSHILLTALCHCFFVLIKSALEASSLWPDKWLFTAEPWSHVVCYD